MIKAKEDAVNEADVQVGPVDDGALEIAIPATEHKSAQKIKVQKISGEELSDMKETHMIVRVVSENPNHASSFSVMEVDAYINTFLAEGWKVINTHFLEKIPEGFVFAWVLVR